QDCGLGDRSGARGRGWGRADHCAGDAGGHCRQSGELYRTLFARSAGQEKEGRMIDAPISRHPDIMSGALCFASTRVPVQTLFDYLEGNSTLADFLDDFPTVTRETALAVLRAARQRLLADGR